MLMLVQVRQDLQDQQVLLDLQEPQVRHLQLLDLLVLQELQVHKVLLALRVLQDHKEVLVQQGLQVLRVIKVSRVILEKQDQQVLKALRVRLDLKET
jgi:ribosomal protein L4